MMAGTAIGQEKNQPLLWIPRNLASGEVALPDRVMRSDLVVLGRVAAHPADLDELIRLAKTLRNPHAEVTTGVDLQVPAIITYLDRQGLRLLGTEVVDIGSWKGNASHAISIRLSPLHIHVVGDSKMTLEQFWQEKKCLAVWED